MKRHSAMGELMGMRMNILAMHVWFYCYPNQELMWNRRRKDLVSMSGI